MGDVTGRHAHIYGESDQGGYDSVRRVRQSGTRPQGSATGAVCLYQRLGEFFVSE